MAKHDPTDISRCAGCGWVGHKQQSLLVDGIPCCPKCRDPWPEEAMIEAKGLLVAAMAKLNARSALYKKIAAFVHTKEMG